MNTLFEVRHLKNIAVETKKSWNKKVAIPQISKQAPIIRENWIGLDLLTYIKNKDGHSEKKSGSFNFYRKFWWGKKYDQISQMIFSLLSQFK